MSTLEKKQQVNPIVGELFFSKFININFSILKRERRQRKEGAPHIEEKRRSVGKKGGERMPFNIQFGGHEKGGRELQKTMMKQQHWSP